MSDNARPTDEEIAEALSDAIAGRLHWISKAQTVLARLNARRSDAPAQAVLEAHAKGWNDAHAAMASAPLPEGMEKTAT